MKKVVVYPGSFDPITNGHLDIIRRGLRIIDELIVLVSYNPDKSSLFTVEERIDMIKKLIGNNPRIRIDSFPGLLVDYVKKEGADVILRGLRAVSDFEYEFQMAIMNRRLDREIETMFLMTGYKWFYASSKLIKEVASLGGSCEGLVPEIVCRKLQERYSK